MLNCSISSLFLLKFMPFRYTGFLFFLGGGGRKMGSFNLSVGTDLI